LQNIAHGSGIRNIAKDLIEKRKSNLEEKENLVEFAKMFHPIEGKGKHCRD
jgi:hypothetical protein